MMTFEKIRELYDKEKGSPKLEQMPEDFLLELSEYLKGNDETIKKVINNLLDRRQQKLINIAMFELKKEIPSKPSNAMLHEEEAFMEMVALLKKMRGLNSLGVAQVSMYAIEKKIEARDIPPPAMAVPPSQTQKEEPADGFCLITQTVPSFIGMDMKTYCLKKGDKVYVPKELREFLEKNGICERLN
jgi:DNA replication initiation complex subunit (GINS family)